MAARMKNNRKIKKKIRVHPYSFAAEVLFLERLRTRSLRKNLNSEKKDAPKLVGDFLPWRHVRQDLPQIWTEVTDWNGSGFDHLLKSGIVAQTFEIDLDPGARGVEIAAAFDRFPQVFERASLVAHHRVRAGDVIPRERVVGAIGQTLS